MHLNTWKSVLVSWANALQVAPTTLNFIGDLSPDFFLNLCSYLKGNAVSSLQEAVTYITDYYKSLILGNEEDENFVALLATAYLIFTSVHKTNDELCKRLCCVSNREQAQMITSALEAFVDIQPAKVTKELMFMTLAQLPEGPESCGNSPYLPSSGSCSSSKGTPGSDCDTPGRHHRRSSRFKRVKHQLHMAMSLKTSLQEELESARETISNLESVVHVRNQDIAQLKERCQRLLNEREADTSAWSSRSRTPVHSERGCSRCSLLERQVATYQEAAVQDKAEIEGLTESLASLTKKIRKLESEKRTLDDHLRLYEEQIQKNNDEISSLKHHHEDLMANRKELECIIEELRDARTVADCSVEAVMPNNLGNEVIDLQLSEMRLMLDEKTKIISERDEDIANLCVKLKGKESEIEQFQNQEVHYKSINGKLEEDKAEYISSIRSLEADIRRLTSSKDLMTSELQGVVEQKKLVEERLKTTEQNVVELNNLMINMSAQLEHDKVEHEAALDDYRKIINERDLMISSCQSTLKHEAIRLKEVENRCMDLEKTVAIKEQAISSLEQAATRITEALRQEVGANGMLNDECKTLRATLAEKSVEISALQDDILRRESAIQRMQQENELCNTKILTLDRNVEKLTGDYEQATTKFFEAKKLKEDIEHQLQESQLRVATVSDTLEKQREELHQSEILYKEQEKLLLLKDEKLSSLEGEVGCITQVVRQEHEKNETLLNEVKTNQLNISRLETAVENYQKEIEHCTLAKRDVELENLKCRESIDALKGEVLRLTNSNQLAASELQDIVEQKKCVEDRLRTTEEKLVELNDLVFDLRKQLELETSKLDTALDDMQKVTRERDQIISSYQTSLEMEGTKLQECETRCNELEKTGAIKEQTISSLEQEATRITEALCQKVDAIASLNDECKTLQSTLAEKSIEISALQAEISQHESAIQKMQQENELCNTKILTLDRNVEKLTGDYEQATTKFFEVKEQKEDIEHQLQESKLRVATVSDKLEKQGEELQKLEIFYKEQEKMLLLKDEKLSSLEGEVGCITQVVRQEHEKNETLLNEVKTNQLNISRLETAVENYQKEIEHCTLAKRDVELENLKCRESIDAFEIEVLRLTNSNQLAVSELQDIVDQKKYVEERLRTTEEKLLELNNLVFDLRNQLEHETAKLNTALEDIQKVMSERNQIISAHQTSLKVEGAKLQGSENRCNELEKTVALKDENISSLEQEAKRITLSLQQEEDANSGLKVECKALQSTLTDKSTEISVLKEEILRSQAVIQETLQDKELSDAKVLSLQNGVEMLTRDYQLATTQLVDAQKIKEDFEQLLQGSQLRISTLSEDLDKHMKEMYKLELISKEQEKVLTEKNEKLSSLDNEVVHITAVVRQERDINEALIQEMETQKHGFEKRRSELEKTVALKEENISLLEQEAKRITLTLQQEEDANSGLKVECKALQSTLTDKSAEIAVLKEEILRSQAVIQEMLQEKELCDGKVLSLQNDVEMLTHDYQLATTQLVDAQKIEEDFEQQLQGSQQLISSLSEDLEKHVKEVHKLELLSKEQEKVLAEKNEKLSSLENEVVHITGVVRQEREINEALIQEMETQKHGFEKRRSELENTVALKEENISLLEQEAKRVTLTLQQEEDANSGLKVECKALQSTLADKSAEISVLKEEILRSQAGIQEMLQKKELCDGKVLSLQNDVEMLTRDYQLATTQLVDAQKIEEDFEQQLQGSQQLISTLSEDLEKHVKEMHNLELSYKEQEKVLAEKNEKLSSLENEVVHITGVVRQEREIKEALIQEMETQKHGFEKRRSELEKTVALKEENISLLEQEAKRVTLTLQQEEDANSGLKVECKALQSTLADKRAEISVLEEEILRSQAVIQEMLQDKELSDAKILSLQNDVEMLTHDYQLATTQLVDAQKIEEDFKQQLQGSQQRISTLYEDLQKHVKDMHKLELSYKEQENVLTEKNEKISSLENEVVHYELIKRETELENLKCKERLHTLETEVRKLTQSNEITDAKLMKILEQKSILEEHLSTLEGDLKGKVGHEEQLQQELIALKTALDKEERCYESLKLEIVLEKANTQTVIRSLQGEVERLANENKLATSRTSSLMSETESLNRRLENYCMDLDIKNETILMMESTLNSVNSNVALLEAVIKEKDSVITGATTDLHNTKAALEKYQGESQRKLHSRVDEMTVVIQQKDAELAKLREENEAKSERIAKMSEELVHVSQTFNVEKTSLIDHAKNLEEMLESSTSAEKELQNKIVTLSKQLELKENKLARLDEKLSLTVELHNCEKRELATKLEFLKTQIDENKLKYDRLVKEIEESNVEHLNGKISRLETESQELKDRLELKIKDIQWYAHEMEVLQKSANNTMKVNAQLEEEVQSLTRSKIREVARLEKDIAMLTEKTKLLEPQASDISAKLRQEYEEKLEKLKTKMRKVYTEKMEAMMKFQTGEEKMYADEELKREKQKRISLESKVRELSDQLLILQEEKRALIANNIFRAPAYPLGGPMSNPAYESPPLHKAQSLDRLPVVCHGLDNLGADLLDQSFASRRTSTSSNRSNHLPKGIGKVFPAAEEDGEVFDNRCLSDLKEGICTLPSGSGGVDRMSILQQRNSMCPPHLKSSYPVESQFFTPYAKEDEIKVIAKGNKENLPEDSRSVTGTPSKLRSLFSGRRKH